MADSRTARDDMIAALEERGTAAPTGHSADRPVVTDEYAYRLFTDALAREGDLLYTRAELDDLGTPVPTCPGWSVGQLLAHVGEVHRHIGDIVTLCLTSRPERVGAPDRVPGKAFLAWCREGSARLRDALWAKRPSDVA